MKVLYPLKKVRNICDYLNSNFKELGFCIDDDSEDFDKYRYIDFNSKKTFLKPEFGFLRIFLKNRNVEVYCKEKYIDRKKYNFEEFKNLLKQCEKELGIGITIKIEEELPDFDDFV